MNKIERIKELTAHLNHCADLYYNSGNSPITDREYDELHGYIDDELFSMFRMFPTNFDFDIVE